MMMMMFGCKELKIKPIGTPENNLTLLAIDLL